MAETRKACEVCGKEGKVCSFERACSCWYGKPCTNGESIRKHRKAAPRPDQAAQGEAGKWECAICREMLNHGEGVAYHKSLGHDIRRVEDRG